VTFVDPGSGYLACGWVGPGRLAEPSDVAAAVELLLHRGGPLAGRRLLVTAGPTVEDLDPVRFIGNRSSGRMGFAIARVARARGADVTLVAGPTSIEPPAVTTLIRVRSAREMHDAVLGHSDSADAIVMAAAVADYTPVDPSAEKIHKNGPLTLRLQRTSDILADLGARRDGASRPVLVGFAAETGNLIARARGKLTSKHVDLVVANDVRAPGAGFDVPTNQVTLVSENQVEELPLMSKDAVAAAILDRVQRLLVSQPAATTR
jgi:phosphopantothenoylcysteine decarboxylase/phosphopantothenate--cysteine ligase